ncbi:MAG: PIN domain-containing protein [Nitrososphaerales archaeon]
MKIIVDTSRIIAALIRNSYSRTILFSDKFEFLTVNLTKSEIEEHAPEILEKARITRKEFDDILSLILRHIQIVSDISIESKLGEARDIMQAIDPDDAIFVAAALAVENEGIWSDDRHFQRQKKTRIFSTTELLDIVTR